MKIRILTPITTTTILGALLVWSPPRTQEQGPRLPPSPRKYTLQMLPGLGGLSGAFSINDLGWAAGLSNPPGDAYDRAFLWREGQITDLATLGGYNSSVGNPNKNEVGWLVGGSETADIDPHQENFCQFTCSSPTGNCLPFNQVCKGFLWRSETNKMVALPPLPGGNNSSALGVNNQGRIVGIAETGPVPDPTCVAPQAFDFEAVVWSLGADGTPFISQQLTPLAGDTVSGAIGINELGQVVGGSGQCGSPGLGTAHAVLWKGGVPMNLGSLGGVTNNLAFAINNKGQIVGASDLPGDQITHAFLWERGAMKDLGALRPDDNLSLAESINDRGEIVGLSCGPVDCHGFHWQAEVMTDLNSVLPPGSPLLITNAADINSQGEIAVQAYDSNVGDFVAAVLIPSVNDDGPLGNGAAANTLQRTVILPENVRKMLQQRGFGRFAGGPITPQ